MEAKEEIAISALAGDFLCYKALPSTQLEAKRLLQQGAPLPFVVVADEQTQGLGRFSRNWLSPPGGTYFSWATRNIGRQGASLVIAMAVRHALCDVIGTNFAIKWPNDILLAGKKTAGILTESSGDAMITGIGINTFAARALPDELLHIAATVPLEVRDRKKIIGKFFDCLNPLWHSFVADGFAALVDEYLNMTMPLNTMLTARCGNMTVTGRFAGVGGDGELILKVDGNTRCFIAGETTLCDTDI